MKQFETFGKYILLERLAAGGMAEVFLAKSMSVSNLSKFVAVKRILPQYSDNPEFIEMFREEARIAMNLNHSNIVPIFDFGTQNNQFFLVMEYVEGQNLRQILNQLKKDAKTFSIEQCVYICKQVAAGLDHAHRCLDNTTGKPLNITHRDMSPQNVMISFEGEVKVVDFGIAKAESEVEHTRAGTIKGKFGYMSPEQAEGLQVDSRTDVFSLGIVLWELLAKDRLFTAANEAATLKKIRECHIPPLRRINPAIPSELERIVNKALAKDKSLRYQSCTALFRDLNKFMNMQYPDFSLHDFSVFMKSTFSSMYIDNRKKLSEYAKISNSPLGQQFEDKHTRTDTRTDSQGRSRVNLALDVDSGEGPSNASGDAGKADEPLDIVNKTNTKVNLKDLQTKVRPLDKFQDKNVDVGGFSRVTSPSFKRSHTHTTSFRKIPVAQEAQTSAKTTVLVLMAFLIAASYFGFRFGYLPVDLLPMSLALKMGLLKDPPFPLEQSSEMPPGKQVLVLVESTPSGALVFKNGIDTGLRTPAKLSAETGRAIKVGIALAGYVGVENTESITKDGQNLKYVLQVAPAAAATPAPPNQTSAPTATPAPNGLTATLSVYVSNGNAETVVYIDDQRIVQKLPVRDRIVPAQKTIKIRAVNPTSHQWAEKDIILNPNEKKDLILTLNLARDANGP